MGLFSKKKEQQAKKPELPPLKFPDLPQEESSEPKQKQISPEEANTIKEAVSSVPQMPPPKMAVREEEPSMTEGEKPLFVKVEKYRDVMNTINHLKEKLKDTNTILNELNRIKDEEEHELSQWQKDLEDIKQKLMTIDKALFES